jgi:DNA primase large subunit
MTSLTKSISITSDTRTAWRENEQTTQRKGRNPSPPLYLGTMLRHNIPHSCQQILTADLPGANDSHGCPYRQFSPDNLQTALLSSYGPKGLTAADLPEIMHAVKTSHYHVACTRVFEITHSSQVKKGDGIGGGECVTHPNQYAMKSRELEKAVLEGVKVTVEEREGMIVD